MDSLKVLNIATDHQHNKINNIFKYHREIIITYVLIIFDNWELLPGVI